MFHKASGSTNNRDSNQPSLQPQTARNVDTHTDRLQHFQQADTQEAKVLCTTEAAANVLQTLQLHQTTQFKPVQDGAK